MQEQKDYGVNSTTSEESTGTRREGFDRNVTGEYFSVHFETVDRVVACLEADSDEAENRSSCERSELPGKVEADVAQLVDRSLYENSCPAADLVAKLLVLLNKKACQYSYLHRFLVEVVKEPNEGVDPAGRYATHCIKSAVDKGFIRIDDEQLCTLMVPFQKRTTNRRSVAPATSLVPMHDDHIGGGSRFYTVRGNSMRVMARARLRAQKGTVADR
jgi:hypothetical protein